MKRIAFAIISLISVNIMFAQTATLKIGTMNDAFPGTILVPITLEAIDNPITGNNIISSWGWYIAYDTSVLNAGIPGNPATLVNFSQQFPAANYLTTIIADNPVAGWNTIAVIYSCAGGGVGTAGMKFFDIQFTFNSGASDIIWTSTFTKSSFSPKFLTNMADDEGNEFYLTLINGSVSLPINTLGLKIFLEGPFNGSTMNTDLNQIPLSQPYNIAPWNYAGTEQVIAIPNPEIVDWVLIESRETTGDASTATHDKIINRQAAFLKSDGNVVGTDGSSQISFVAPIINNLYIVIRHRNHLPIMSSAPLTENLDIYSWDFTDQLSKAYLDGQIDIGGGKFGMIAGDCNASGRINTIDENYNWSWNAGNSGYYRSDVNLDSQVNNIDKDETWLPNIGFIAQLPEGLIFYCGAELLDDRDGQFYNTAIIDGHCWMAENLNIGTGIDGSAEQTDNAIFEKYCYNDDETNCNDYGGLYQWNEMMQYTTQQGIQGICPNGWHIPAEVDWTMITDFLGGENVAGGKLKEKGNLHWFSPNTGATNESGFTALAGGTRSSDGSFDHLLSFANFWSSAEQGANTSWYRALAYSSPNIYTFNSDKNYGFSVRCIMNNEPPLIPSDPQPTNSAINQPVNTTLSWTCTDPNNDLILYDVFLDTINPPSLVSAGQTGNTFNPDSLAYGKTYFWQIAAYDYSDTTMGPVWSFLVQNGPCPGIPIVTYEGQIYNTLQIGTQCWFKENLNVGIMINGSINQSNNSQIEKYCYNNNAANCSIYGGLYRWDETMQYTTQVGTQGICPSGWHIPTDAEWTVLTDFLGDASIAGGKMKEAGYTHWISPNTGATNESGFTAIPGGQYWIPNNFFNLTGRANFWSSTQYDPIKAWSRCLDSGYASVWGNQHNKNGGLSVRCVRDIPNQPPSVPSTPQPSDGAVNQPISNTLSWICTDPDNDPLTYDIYFGTSNPPSLLSSGQTATTYNPGQLDYNTSYYWKIIAYDDHTNFTEGPIWSFSTGANQPPFQPSTPQPSDGAVNQPIGNTLSWICTDPDNDPLTYDVYFGTSNPPSLLSSGQTATTYNPGQLDYSTSYYWKIIAHDDHINFTEGTIWSFSTIANQPPFQPSNPTPPNGSQNQLLNTTLSWTCGDPDNDPLSYDVYFGTSNPPSLLSSGQTATTYNPGQLDYNTSYYWKIIAYDDHINFTEGTIWSFSTIANQPPFQPSNPTPPDGSQNQLLNTTLSWTCGDPDNDPLSYDVYFGTINPPAIVSTGQIDNSYNPGQLDYNTSYYWKIVAHDDYNNNTEGPVWSFTATNCISTFIDSRDGQTYNAVPIGTQCWMADNLNIGTRNDGSTEQTDNLSLEKYCYDDDEANCDVYGGLYQWNEMMQYVITPGVQGICPAGWHLPTDAEWTILTTFLGGEAVAGGKMKATGTIEAGTGLWYAPNAGATNESGFTAISGGGRYYEGYFDELGHYAYIWTSSEISSNNAWNRTLLYYLANVNRSDLNKGNGFSVRCLKN